MPRLFLPNIAAGVIPNKPLFPQESQSLQGLVARKRMLFPVFHTLPHFGIHLLVVIVQNYLHSLQYLCFAMQRYEEKTERQIIPIKILSKSACVIILFSFVYSIGRIIDSMNWISSSARPYFLYSSSSVQSLVKSWRGTKRKTPLRQS